MRIVHVIHGYPPRYNAGSEVYTQTLCHGLAERHTVHTFTREEDAFAPDFRQCCLPRPVQATQRRRVQVARRFVELLHGFCQPRFVLVVLSHDTPPGALAMLPSHATNAF